MSVVTARAGWVGRSYTGGGSVRGAVAGVRRRWGERKRRLALEVGVAVVAAFVIALSLVWVRLQVVHVGYDLSTARQLERKLEQEQRELTLEIAALTSPRRLEEMARVRLGMRPPLDDQVVNAP